MKDHRRIIFCFGASLLVIAPLLTAQSRPLSSADATELAAGKRIFDAQCAWCHGTDGSGGAGPSLQRPDLRHAGTDADLTSIVRNGIAATEMPGFQWSLTDTMTWRTAAYVRSLGRRPAQPVRGHATRGAVIYEAKGCQTCHVIAGRGTALGPELTAIGALRGPAYLREAIVKPEAAHPPGYLVVRAVSGTGGEVRGIRIDEDVFWIHIRDAAGTLHVLEKKQLQRVDRELTGTLMPSYASVLSVEELDNLVAYLASRRSER
jgi:putative heme-binding domain-containing protein